MYNQNWKSLVLDTTPMPCPSEIGGSMKDYFALKEKGTTVKTEVVAGLTTFFTMAYIIFVNPTMLATTGMSWDGVFVATCLASVVGTLIMALFANVPYAVAPGMGLNALFAFTVCAFGGFNWKQALGMVFICGLINIIITVTKLRKSIVKSIPESLQNAIGGAIGLFIAYLGLNNSGLISFSIDYGLTAEQSAMSFADLSASGALAHPAVTPGMAPFQSANLLLAVIGLVIIVILMVMKIKGAILIGIVATTVIGIPLGVTHLPQSIFSDAETVAGFKEVAFALFEGDGIGSLFTDASKIPFVIVTIFSMCLSDTFDSIGTFIGTGRKTGIFDAEDEKSLEGSGFKSRLDKALVADSFATSIGALFGTSNATTYVESSAGIAAGGKTGLTSLVTAIMFLICIPFAGLIGMVPGAATSPALIVVGILMVEPFAKINWHDFEEAVPAFFTVAIMGFTYGITNGIAAGFIMYCITKIFTKKASEIHPIIAGAAILFIVDMIIKAIG